MAGRGSGYLGVLIVALQAGCTTVPQVSSLDRIKLDAQREAAKNCYQTYSRAHPNVPILDVRMGCWRAYGLMNSEGQRVTF